MVWKAFVPGAKPTRTAKAIKSTIGFTPATKTDTTLPEKLTTVFLKDKSLGGGLICAAFSLQKNDTSPTASGDQGFTFSMAR